ncbi:MAG: hypothetical protein PWP04_670 [Candidatus Atribacteria bacterium]|nr:hypothetical protein [Candidatus Atribacteria bacterium]
MLEQNTLNSSVKQEIQEKLARLRKLMGEKGLEALLLKRHVNFSWLTAGGTNVLCMAQDNGVTSVLVTSDKSYVIASNIEAPRMKEEEKVVAKGFELVEYPWYEGNEMKVVREICGEGAIGCDIAFSGTQNLSGEINRCRYQLLETEKERYLWLGREVSWILEEVLCSVHPGVLESEVAAEVARKLWEKRIEPIGLQAAADERAYKFRHPIAFRNPVRKLLLASVMAKYAGLVTTVTRMVHFGMPSPEFLKQYHDNVRIECEMIALSKPGNKVVLPLQRAVELYRELGYSEEWKHHHQGGAMGYLPRDYRVDFECQENILENQAFCWNPSIAGTKSEDGFISTSQGPLFITYPVRFPVFNLEVGDISFNRPDLLLL